MNRILVWGLSNRRAGTENVIYNFCKTCTSAHFDFLTFEDPQSYDELFDNKQNRYFVITPKSKNPVLYYKELKAFVKQHAKEYAALWFNTNHAANIDLLILANRYGIPRRIVHSHNSSNPKEPLLKVLSILNTRKCNRLATEKWACSEVAGLYLFKNSRYTTVANMVDVERCSFSLEGRESFRSAMGLTNAFIVGSIGRLASQKNHSLLLSAMPKTIEKNPLSHLVLVGEGELKDRLLDQAAELGIEDKFTILPPQSDMSGLLSSFDVFAFPSHFEGLPLSLLEAQFNGLPCFVSNKIENAAIISEDTVALPLNDACLWGSEIVKAKRRNNPSLLPSSAIYNLASNQDKINELFASPTEGAL